MIGVCALRTGPNKIYHVDWSPDSRFLGFSRGPDGQGDPKQPGTFQAACEIVGVHAAGWNLCAVSAEREGVSDLNDPAETGFSLLTTNGCSNKEPAWFLHIAGISLGRSNFLYANSHCTGNHVACLATNFL